MNNIVYLKDNTFQLGSNKFINVPIIWQHDDTPILELLKTENIKTELSTKIFDSDGTYIAVQRGGQIYLTPEGKNADIQLSHPPGMTVLKHSGRTLFEIRRISAAAVAIDIEMYTQTGSFVRLSEHHPIDISNSSGASMQIGGAIISNSVFHGWKVGIHTFTDGRLIIGEGGGSMSIGSMSF